MFTMHIFRSLYIFFIILALNIFFFSTTNVRAKAFLIEEIEISEPFRNNFDKNSLINRGFKTAFYELINLLVKSSDYKKINTIKLNEIKSMIESFSIKEEKFIQQTYYVNIGVSFNKNTSENFLTIKENIIIGTIGTINSGWFMMKEFATFLSHFKKINPKTTFRVVTKDDPQELLRQLSGFGILQEDIEIYSASSDRMPDEIAKFDIIVMFFISDFSRSSSVTNSQRFFGIDKITPFPNKLSKGMSAAPTPP